MDILLNPVAEQPLNDSLPILLILSCIRTHGKDVQPLNIPSLTLVNSAGRIIFAVLPRLTQSWNTYVPIVVALVGSATSSAAHPKNALLPIVVTFIGIALFKDLQPENASEFIELTVSGKTKSASSAQFINALLPMEVTSPLRTTFLRLEQSWNTLPLMALTPLGTVISLIPVQSMKAFEPMDVTFSEI